jgi:hypothetical protein
MPHALTGGLAGLPQLKSGRTSAPRLPQAWHTNRASISDNLASSGQLSPLMANRVAAAVVGAVREWSAHWSRGTHNKRLK